MDVCNNFDENEELQEDFFLGEEDEVEEDDLRHFSIYEGDEIVVEDELEDFSESEEEIVDIPPLKFVDENKDIQMVVEAPTLNNKNKKSSAPKTPLVCKNCSKIYKIQIHFAKHVSVCVNGNSTSDSMPSMKKGKTTGLYCYILYFFFAFIIVFDWLIV